MPNWLHRDSKVFLRSVAGAELPSPELDYIRDPDLSAVEGWATKYWVISGDTVSLMDAAARAAVDAAELEAMRDLVVTQLDAQEDILRAFMLAVLDELNAHALKTNAILDAIDQATNLASLQTAVGQIADYPQRTPTQMRSAVRTKLGS